MKERFTYIFLDISNINMSSTLSETKQCVTCNKIGGILICSGCNQTFCGKHVIQHRQQLEIQLENIMQEHDCIQQDILVEKNNLELFQQIEQWEKESIIKIQMVAEKTRIDLRQILENSNKEITNTCRDIAAKLRSAREEENFSEIDLTHWNQKLEQLKLQIKSQAMICIPENNEFSIQFISIKQNDTANTLIEHNDVLLPQTVLPVNIQERFEKVNGLAIIEDEGLSLKHNDKDFKYIYCHGRQLYNQGRHTIRFKIDKCTDSCNFFVGICPSTIILRLSIYHHSLIAGWFSNAEVRQHGARSHSNEASRDIDENMKVNDIFELTLDCDIQQIELFYERINKKKILNVDINKTPLPWYILLALFRTDDCIRILSST